MCLNSDAHSGVRGLYDSGARRVYVSTRGGMRPIDALRSSPQQLPREDVTVNVRGAVVRAVKKRSTLVSCSIGVGFITEQTLPIRKT